ncbi:GP46-like surface antigen, putative [Bodo saltans]|uniref:GP46-like surface antigen, putative n=1 Tax=Bodo saltans TaxID=75058 RepID=A0A0S4JNW2_BODSA|nr:GP46-like surface antigen, putative [Bodo saltans]|eukprot:CUG92348.1 GP46-like surface antigen, putative [Bodo saltans]
MQVTRGLLLGVALLSISVLCHAIGAADVPRVTTGATTTSSIATACICSLNITTVLLELYAATNGNQWRQSASWNTSACPSQWYGVSCSSKGLMALVLPNNNLQGALPSSLGNMTSLVTVSLYGNHLTGSLHSSWSLLVNLKILFLHENSLEGTLPASWSTLTKLEQLYLSTNSLSGSLPSEWSAMTQLEQVFVFLNRLTGELPVSWGSMSKLTILNGNENAFSGSLPAAWSGMRAMQQLSFFGNLLTGVLPANWSAMVALKGIYLYENSIGGSLPSEWSSLSQLEILHLHSNNLSGSIPDTWSALSSLTTFSIFSNFHSGTLPMNFGNLTNLETLSLFGNQFTGTLHSSWGSLKNLKILFLHQNSLEGTLPPSWSKLTKLEQLYLSTNSLSGSLPSEWSAMTELQQVFIFLNRLTGELPASWGSMSKLTILNGNENAFSGSLPAAWSGMRAMQQLSFFGNLLTGVLPANWSAMVALKGIYLYENSIAGSLPSEWSALSHLELLYLYSNNLSGSIPVTWSALRNLTTLSIFNNVLTGTLPDAFHALENLQTISLYNNCLTGTLPSSWSSLTNLRVLVVNSNSLMGTLPLSWSSMTLLQQLYLHRNAFVGSLPSDWVRMERLEQLLLSYNYISSSLPEIWKGMKRLTLLGLRQNSLVGSLPHAWGTNLFALQELYLDHNMLDGPLPNEWNQFNNLTMLQLQHNYLSGPMPKEWGDGFTSLAVLNVSDNCLRGSSLASPDFWQRMFPLSVDVCGTRLFIPSQSAAGGEGPVSYAPCDRRLVLWPHQCTTTSTLTVATSAPSETVLTTPSHGSVSSSEPLDAVDTASSLSAAQITAIAIPIALGGAVGALLSSDSSGGDAQVLFATLNSPCVCDGSRSGSLSGRAVSIVMSPLSVFMQNDEADVVAIGTLTGEGNMGIMIGVVGLYLALIFLFARLSANDNDRAVSHSVEAAHDQIQDDASPLLQADGKETTRVSMSNVRLRQFMTSPRAGSLGFPAVPLKVALFLTPGIAWSVAVVLSYEDATPKRTPWNYFVTVLSFIFLISVPWLCEVVMFRRILLRKHWKLVFQAYKSGRFQGGIPVPRSIMWLVATRDGAWGPVARSHIGSPLVTPYNPAHYRYAWAVGHISTTVVTILTTWLPSNQSIGCTSLQVSAASVLGAVSLFFIIAKPHRMLWASMVASFGPALNATIVLLGIMCRYDVVDRNFIFAVSTCGAYISMIGKIIQVAFSEVERRFTKQRVDDAPIIKTPKSITGTDHQSNDLLNRTQSAPTAEVRSEAALSTLVGLICDMT